MQPKNIIMYTADDYVYLWHNNNLYKEKLLKTSVYYGKLNNIKEYTKSLNILIKKLKLNKGFKNDNITLIIDPLYNNYEIECIKEIYEKLGFNKINIINILKLFKLKRNNIIIVFNNNYLYFCSLNYKTKLESIFIDYKLFLNNLNLLAEYLSYLINEKQVVIFGYNEGIEKLASKLEEKTKNKVFYINDSNTYILNKLKNTL